MIGSPMAAFEMLLPLIAIVAIVTVVWALLPPGDRFLRGFAGLLTDAVIIRRPASLLTGRLEVHGTFNGRDTALRLQLKRRRRQRGSLVVAMSVTDGQTLGYEAIERRIRDAPGREALFALRSHRLLVQLAQGWLTADWHPQHVIVFPGAFVEEPWQRVLASMDAVATLLERRSLAAVGDPGSGHARPDPSAPRA